MTLNLDHTFSLHDPHHTSLFDPPPGMDFHSRGFLGSIKKKLGRSKSKNTNSTSRQSSWRSSTSVPSTGVAAPLNNRASASSLLENDDVPPPPAYTPIAVGEPLVELPASPANSTAQPVITNGDDRFSFLASFDTVFLIDDSGSMAGRSWRETRKALESIAPICTAYDADGIDIHFLNAKDSEFYCNVKDASTVQEIFSTVRPGGGTPTGQRLNNIMRPYLQRYETNPERTKPMNIIVITDGEPTDDVESVLIRAAKKLDRLDAPAWQVGVQFFQVGREPGAREHLKQLDDELSELAGDDELRDIVDTVPFKGEQDTELNGEGILKVVLGAVNRRLDRKKSKELHR